MLLERLTFAGPAKVCFARETGRSRGAEYWRSVEASGLVVAAVLVDDAVARNPPAVEGRFRRSTGADGEVSVED